MKLRSGRNLVMFDKFIEILNEDKSSWPTENQAVKLSIDTLDPKKFAKHCMWLQTYAVESHEEVKTNRLIMMATAQSVMNVWHDPLMSSKFNKLVKVIIDKFNTCYGMNKETYDFIHKFKRVCV